MEDHVEVEDAAEEEGPDWRMLAKYTKSLGARVGSSCVEPFIPRRGEKDFEPLEELAAAQTQALKESRQALFSALSAGARGHSSKDHVRCVWFRPRKTQPGQPSPEWIAPYVDGVAKGVLFTSIGSWNRERKRLELSPEELLYLVERGTVQCWSAASEEEGKGSIPMSVQWAWTDIIGSGGLSLERYQVYAFLKRLGYIVLRKEHTQALWRLHSSKTASRPTASLALSGLTSRIHRYSSSLGCWCKNILLIPFRQRRHNSFFFQLHTSLSPIIWTSYASVFTSLRLIPCGPEIPVPQKLSQATCGPNNAGFEVFYYVYKPNNRFPKSNPPAPDFQVCVVDAQKVPVPGIAVTTSLLDTVKGPGAPCYPQTVNQHDSQRSTSNNRSFLLFFTSLMSCLFSGTKLKGSQLPQPRRQNIYAKLKNGERDVLLAVVDHGIISFLKFAETDFGGMPLVGLKKTS